MTQDLPSIFLIIKLKGELIMGILRNGILGDLSGKIGDFVFRNRDGKVVVSVLPGTYKVNNSKKAVDSRENFSVSTQLSKALIKDALLKKIWATAQIEGKKAYNRIIKYNNGQCRGQNLTTDNIITPPGDVEIAIDTLNLSPSEISFTINHKSGEIGNVLNPSFQLYVCLYAYDPIKVKERFEIITATKDINQIPGDNQYNIPLNVAQQHTLSKYRKTIVYIAAAKSGGTNLKWTSTYAEEFRL
jgi:hypothetical protein